MHVINKDMPDGLDTEISVMPYEDAKSIYDSTKDGNIKFKTDFRRAVDEDTFGEVALAATQSFANQIEQVPTGLKILWGQGNIAESSAKDWAFGLVSKTALRIAGAPKGMAEAITSATEQKRREIMGTDKLRKRGEQLILTANRSLEELRKRQRGEQIRLKESHPIIEGLISTGEQYGAAMLMAYVPFVGPALSTAYITSLEASGTAVEGIEQYKKQHPEDKELKGFMADEKATKEFALNTLKTMVNGVEEYILGPIGQARHQAKMAKAAAKGFKATKYGALKYVGKEMALGAASEFTEEGLLQGTSDTVFDYLLGRYNDKDEAITAWKDNLAQSAFAGLFGGAFGMGGAIYSRAKGIQATRELLRNVVPEQDLDKVATAVFENELKNVMDVATVGLEISSQLNFQKGEIYDAFRNAAFQAAKESGGYKGLTDESLWAHINEVSERFAQEAVAEAFKRKVPIQEVIDSHDIIYKDGELHFAKTEQSKLAEKIKKVYEAKKQKKPTSLLQFLIMNGGLKDSGGELKALDAIKGRPGLVNNKYGLDLDHAREIAAEAGYFGGNPTDDVANTTVSDFLDLIDKELRGQRVYTPEGDSQAYEAKQNEEVDPDYLEYLYEQKLDEYNVDYKDMTLDQKRQAAEELQSMEREDSAPEQDESTLSQEDMDALADMTWFQESYDLAEEMSAIDANNEAYTGNTIDINGTQKTVYNSNGEHIAKSEAALRAFYNWFGDSKVVDEQGRPLIVYHGSHAQFDEFSKDFIGKGRGKLWGDGFYFTNSKARAENISKGFFGQGKNSYVYPVYLKMENPLVDGKMGAIGNEYDGRIQHGAGTTAQEHYYIVKEPNQIKSTENKGTWSNEKNNIYEQSAYAGSRVDYDKPSLEAIGTGEGHQAHGYGLYYALNKDVAEYYRRAFLGAKYNGVDWKNTVIAKYDDFIQDALLSGDKQKQQRVLKFFEDALSKYKKQLEATKNEKTTGMSSAEKALRKIQIQSAQESIERLTPVVEFVRDFDIKNLKTEGGQVHQVEIPELEFLINEDEQINNQSDTVRRAVREIMNENPNTYAESESYEKGSFGEALTGKSFYSELMKIAERNGVEKRIDQKKYASNVLEKHGIKGISYDGRQDGRCFVIFNPEDVKVIQKFYQVDGLGKNKAVQRGSFNANSKVIKLFENANTSTLPHELAHYWLDNMWNYAKSGNASPQYVAQFNAVKEFLGVKPEQENLTRAQHEKFASAYEKYLYRGEFPKPIIGVVFDNYERFIRDVYQSINDIRAQGKSKVRLTPEIIQFFDSMISGELPTMAENANVVNEARAEEVHQYDSKIVEEVKKEIQVPVEAPTQTATTQEILPVGSSGEIAESRFAKRSEIATGIETSMQYERANMEKERQKAAEMWKNDPQKAQAELNNATIGNDVLRSALYTEQQRIALENGDTQTYLKSVRKQSAEATRAGQEIAALRGVMEDITMPTYWIRLAEWEAQKQLAKNMATYFDKVMGNTPLMNFTQKFDSDVKALYEKVKSAKTNAEKSQIMKDGLEQMKKTYRGLNQQELGELYQTDWTNEELAYDYVEKKARDAIGLNLSNEKANAIIQASRDLDKLSRKVDEFGIPTADFFAKKSELEYMINSHTPSSQTKVLLSTLGRANMLTAPATSVLNVASNVQNFGAQKLVRMLNNKITGHTNENLVDPNLQKQYRKRVWDTFWATGYDLAMMNDITDTRLYRGESAVNSAGEGVIRQAGQWAEKHIFGELISSPDMVFKSYLAFTDFAGNEATDVALKEGLSGEKAKKRANELFTDAIKIEPKTEIGKQIRAKAQADALVITFQQDTRLARTLLDLRNLINKATGDIGVGDLLSAFVKTPANVLALGYDATVGPFGHLINTFGAIQDARAGNLNSARVMATLRQTTTMAVMQAIVAAFALGFIDDDDYIPDYSQLSPSERLIVKERGGSFGSIRIGDTYISTDFFGPFELPLTAWLNARRQDGFAQSASAYIGSVIRKGMDAPVIKDLMDQAKAAEEVGSDSLSIWEHIYDTAGNLLISRLTPNVMNTLAKMSDDYERETNRKVLNKLISRVPGLRQTLPPKMSVSTGKPIETPNAFLQLFFGARAHRKVDSAVADELYRLYQQGERATISDITRSGDLKLIDEKDKQGAKEWFAREYSSAALKVIKSADYRSKSDEEKKNALNKIRRDLVKQLKEKHKNKISVAKQKK